MEVSRRRQGPLSSSCTGMGGSGTGTHSRSTRQRRKSTSSHSHKHSSRSASTTTATIGETCTTGHSPRRKPRTSVLPQKTQSVNDLPPRNNSGSSSKNHAKQERRKTKKTSTSLNSLPTTLATVMDETATATTASIQTESVQQQIHTSEHAMEAEHKRQSIKAILLDCKRRNEKPPLHVLREALELGVIEPVVASTQQQQQDEDKDDLLVYPPSSPRNNKPERRKTRKTKNSASSKTKRTHSLNSLPMMTGTAVLDGAAAASIQTEPPRQQRGSYTTTAGTRSLASSPNGEDKAGLFVHPPSPVAPPRDNKQERRKTRKTKKSGKTRRTQSLSSLPTAKATGLDTSANNAMCGSVMSSSVKEFPSLTTEEAPASLQQKQDPSTKAMGSSSSSTTNDEEDAFAQIAYQHHLTTDPNTTTSSLGHGRRGKRTTLGALCAIATATESALGIVRVREKTHKKTHHKRVHFGTHADDRDLDVTMIWPTAKDQHADPTKKWYRKGDLQRLLDHELRINIAQAARGDKPTKSKSLHCCWRGLENIEQGRNKAIHNAQHVHFVLKVQKELRGEDKYDLNRDDILRSKSREQTRADRKKAHSMGLKDSAVVTTMIQSDQASEKAAADLALSQELRQQKRTRQNRSASVLSFFTSPSIIPRSSRDFLSSSSAHNAGSTDSSDDTTSRVVAALTSPRTNSISKHLSHHQQNHLRSLVAGPTPMPSTDRRRTVVRNIRKTTSTNKIGTRLPAALPLTSISDHQQAVSTSLSSSFSSSSVRLSSTRQMSHNQIMQEEEESSTLEEHPPLLAQEEGESDQQYPSLTSLEQSQSPSPPSTPRDNKHKRRSHNKHMPKLQQQPVVTIKTTIDHSKSGRKHPIDKGLSMEWNQIRAMN